MYREREKRTVRIPIFLFDGLLEAGKTTFIAGLLEKPAFADGKQTLVICCEEGIEEFDKELLEKNKIALVQVEDEDEFSTDLLRQLDKIYKPQRVIIEFNGMWSLEKAFDVELPNDWFLYQSLVLINGETFNLYMNNMRSIMIEHFKTADLVIMNRCNEEVNLSLLTGAVKSINGQAKLFSCNEELMLEPIKEELPFDLEAEVIDIKEEHFGIWYIDLWEEPTKYIRRKIKVRGLFFQQPTDPKDCFSFGRFAMPCCEEDVSFMGLYCKNIGKPRFKDKDSVELVGEIYWEEAEVYEGKGPVFHVKSLSAADKNQTEWVTF